MAQSVQLSIHLGVLDGLRHVLDTDYLLGLFGYEIGNRTRAGIEVIDGLRAGQFGKVARYLIQLVRLPGIGLIERLGSYLELQSLHLFHQVVLTRIYAHVEVTYRIVHLLVDDIHQAHDLREGLMDRT